jgi:hypothetical protein
LAYAAAVLSGEVTHTYFIVFGLTRSGLEHMTYRTRGEQANHFNHQKKKDNPGKLANIGFIRRRKTQRNWQYRVHKTKKNKPKAQHNMCDQSSRAPEFNHGFIGGVRVARHFCFMCSY